MTDWFSVAIWSLVGTWVLVVGTLLLMYWQTRTSQKLNSANAVMALRERFDGPHMRGARRALAADLLEGKREDLSSVEVVTFFELVGTLTHHEALEAELVWEAFGTWVGAYYVGIRHPVDRVERIRTDLGDPLIFHEFEWLYRRMLTLDVRHGPRAQPTPEAEATTAQRILALEAALPPV
ncbi:MAG TPA: hypothetical protein VMH49_02625 [Thermoplasmata archaeon]|nr:hypothetical protein [Thermoplasmata archaeon]